MPVGEHFHHFHIVLKAVVTEEDVTREGGEGIRETVTVWKECDCGCVNKSTQLVTHLDGREW